MYQHKKGRLSKSVRNYYWTEYKWILSFVKPHKFHVGLLIICGLLLTMGQIIIPKAFQLLIDELIPSQNIYAFLGLMGVVIIIIIVMIFATGIKNMQQRLLREKAAKDLQYATFEKLRTLGFSYIEKHPTGEILSLINTDVNDVQKIYRDYFPNIILNLIMILVLVVILLSMNWLLSLIILPCYLLYYIIGPWVEKQAFIYLKKYNENRVELEKHVYETMSSMQELRAYDALKWRMSSFLEIFNQFNRNWIISIFYAHMRGSIRRVTVYLAVLLLFWLGALQVRDGMLSVGEFVAFYFYFFLLMFTITYLVTNITEQQTLMIQAARLYHFYHQPIDIQESPNPIHLKEVKGSIQISNLSFTYNDQNKILNQINISIQPGESLAIVGESGCGKSTLIKLMGRFYDPQQGEICIDNIPIKEMSFKQLREQIGFVFQECYLFGSSVQENIRFGNPNASNEEVIEAAKKAYAHDFITQLPDGYETLVGERGYRLSGGQKQRISIARMFIKNPKIVILDEATSALDNESEAHVQRALDALSNERTTITVAHRLSTIQHSNRIILMRDGRIIEQGTYTELMSRDSAFNQLAKSSNKENLAYAEE